MVCTFCEGSCFSQKHPVVRVIMTIQEEVGFIGKPDIIQELLVIVNLLRKPLGYGYPFLYRVVRSLVRYIKKVYNFPAIVWKEKKIKFIGEIWEASAFFNNCETSCYIIAGKYCGYIFSLKTLVWFSSFVLWHISLCGLFNNQDIFVEE